MMLNIQRWSLVTAIAGVFMIAGCSSNKRSSDAPAVASDAAPETAAPQDAAPSGVADHGDSAEKVTPAGTVEEIWTQISAEQDKLSAVLQNGQLGEVHPLAYGIRDLVVALADHAKAASPATASRLNGLVEQVKSSATRLDALGDAGNLSGTQAEFAKLNTTLLAINAIASGK